MDATELRIGNWISSYVVYADDTVIKNVEISKKKVTADDIKFMADNFLATYQGIELTPEILEKCGFKWETENNTHLQLDFDKTSTMSFYYEGGVPTQLQLYNLGHFEHFFFTPPQFLHQLQNILYALSGEEINYIP